MGQASNFWKKKIAFRKLKGLKLKSIGAASLISLLEGKQRFIAQHAFNSIREESSKGQTKELFNKLDQNLQ